MWGAIIGDLAGSIYEYQQYKKVSIVSVGEKLITNKSFFTDDSILTIAIYDAILSGKSFEECLRQYGHKYRDYKPRADCEHFQTAFGGRFIKWLDGIGDSKSIGNGAMMRISGVGKMFNTEEEVIEQARLATVPSHNSIEAVECSRIVALVIFYARMGFSKEEIFDKIGFKTVEYRPFEHFNKTCYETLENCLCVVFNASNFEHALKNAIEMGGDTDTNGAIVGAMAEALYGVPEYLTRQARKFIPVRFSRILDKAYDAERRVF